MTSEPLLVDVKAVCKMLSISRATYFSMKSAGRIAPQEIRFGKKILLRHAEIVDWVAAGCPAKRMWHWKYHDKPEETRK